MPLLTLPLPDDARPQTTLIHLKREPCPPLTTGPLPLPAKRPATSGASEGTLPTPVGRGKPLPPLQELLLKVVGVREEELVLNPFFQIGCRLLLQDAGPWSPAMKQNETEK